MELKLGDRIYKCRGGNPIRVLTIDRTTKKQAVSIGVKFRKNYGENGRLDQVGSSGSYSVYSYYIETEELKKKYRRHLMIKKLQQLKFEDLEDKDLEAMVKIVAYLFKFKKQYFNDITRQ